MLLVYATCVPGGPFARDHSDVLIIGGGVTGSAAAYYAAKAGLDVALLDRHDLNTAASGRNAGSLHAQIQHEPFILNGEEWARAFAPTIALLTDSIAIWRGLSEELGVDLEVSIRGGLMVAETEAQMRDLARKAAIERAHGLEVELLSPAQLRRAAPYVSDQMAGAELCPTEGKANPLLAAPALARAAIRYGARVHQRHNVRRIDRTSGGFRVDTAERRFDCSRLVLCGGAETSSLANLLGVHLPVDGHAIQTCVTERVAPLIEHLVYFTGAKLTLKQAKSGALLIGGGWPAQVDRETGRARTDTASLRENLRVAQTVVPKVGQARVVRAWTGVVNGTPDHRPVIGELEQVPGLIVGTFPYMGFTAGPIMGRLLVGLARGDDPGLDLRPFSPQRFG